MHILYTCIHMNMYIYIFYTQAHDHKYVPVETFHLSLTKRSSVCTTM